MTETGDKADRTLRRLQAGVVRSRSGDKTIGVTLSAVTKHPMYGKYIRRATKVLVHDPDNAAKVGDQVEIVPCRRMSKGKSWRLVRVVRTSETAEAGADRG